MRRSSKSPLKSVALEMLLKAQAELRKGTEPTTTRKLSYEDLRQILLDDYKDKGRLVMDGEDPVITGRRGHLKALDGYFKGMSAVAITVHTLRNFKAERMANGASGPTCPSGSRVSSPHVQARVSAGQTNERPVLPDGAGVGAS